MGFTLDQEIATILAAAAAADAPAPTPRGDTDALRALTDATLGFTDTLEPAAPDVDRADFTIAVEGGEILARWYTKRGSAPGSAVVFFHGGGMVCGTVDLYDNHVASYTQETGVPFLSVDYRLAPEHPGATRIEDSYAALLWLRERAAELGVDKARIAVMGDSGGGGVAAGVAIAARDRGIPLAKQILIYPMLDDRNLEADPEIAPFATWTYDQNYTGWHAVLGDRLAGDDVSPLEVPARLTDYAGLAPAFIDVGELDIFRDEDIAYASELVAVGVSTEFHLRAGAPHGYDRLARASTVGKQSWEDRFTVIEAL